MIDLLILLGLNSALCFGVWNACLYEQTDRLEWDGYKYNKIYNKGVLWFIDKWAKDKWFYKPLCGCLPCMASLHSIYPYWMYMFISNNLDYKALMIYPVYILALSGVNYLIDRE
jgi:hypothetical protein